MCFVRSVFAHALCKSNESRRISSVRIILWVDNFGWREQNHIIGQRCLNSQNIFGIHEYKRIRYQCQCGKMSVCVRIFLYLYKLTLHNRKMVQSSMGTGHRGVAADSSIIADYHTRLEIKTKNWKNYLWMADTDALFMMQKNKILYKHKPPYVTNYNILHTLKKKNWVSFDAPKILRIKMIEKSDEVNSYILVFSTANVWFE